MSGQTGAGGKRKEQDRLCRERVDCVPDWIWEVSLEGAITYTNAVVEELLGFTPADVIGKNIFDIMSPEDATKCRTALSNAIRERRAIRNVITRLRTTDGHTRTVEMSCVPMFDEQQNLTGFRGIARDITEELAQQRMTQEVEASYKTLVENSQTGIFIVQDTKVVYANPRILEIVGFAEEEVVGVPIWAFVHPDDVEWLKAYYYRRMAGEQVPGSYVARGVTKSGEIRYFDFRSALIQHKGAPAVLLNSVDLTDRIKAEDTLARREQAFRDLVEKISDWVWRIDENGFYAYVSPRVRDLLGYEPEEVLGKTPFDFMPPDEAICIKKIFNRTAEKREPFTLLENTLVHRDGHRVFVETSGMPIFDEQGGFRGYRGIDRDITERKQAEAAMLDTEERYRDLFENNPNPMWIFDLETLEFLAVNETAIRHYGYSREEFLSMTLKDIRPPEDVPRLIETIRTREPGFDLTGVWRHIRKDGSMINVEVATHGLTFAGRNAQLALMRDITDRLHAEEALRRTTSELEAVFTAFPDLYFWLDADGTIINFRTSSPQDLYVTPDEFMGKHIQDVLPPDVSQQLADAIVRVRETSSLVAIEYPLMTGGAEHYYEARLMPLYADQLIVIVRNITERKLAERQLHDERNFVTTVLDTAKALVVVFDTEGKIVGFNRECELVTGYSFDEVRGKYFWDVFLSDEDSKMIQKGVKRLRATGVSSRHENYWIAKDGTRRLVAWMGSAMRDEHGKVEYIIGTGVDITERKKVEDELRRSREMLRLVLSNIPQYVFWKDKNSVYLGCNENFAKAAGIEKPEDIVGKTDYDLAWRKEEADSFREWDRRVMESDKPEFHIIEPQLHASGKQAWLDTNKIPLHDEEGRVIGILGTYEDITERVKAEEALKDSEQQLSTIINFLPDATFAVDLSGKIITWNRAMEELSGVKAEDVLSKGDFEYAIPFYGIRRPMLVDLILKRDEETERLYSSLQKDGMTITAEVKAPSLRPGGGYMWSKATPLYDAHGNMIGAIESVRDITERKQTEDALQEAEAKYRSLVEETLVGVYLIQDGQFTYVNPRFVEIFGYESQDEIVGRSIMDLIAPSDRELVLENIRKRGAGEVKSVRYTFQALRKDGRVIDVEVHGASTIYHGQQAIIGSLVDITERKRYVEALRDSEERYRQLFEHSPDMVFVFSLKNRAITAVNPAVTRILGYEPYDVLGKTAWEISPEFQPDGRSSQERSQAIMDEQLAVGMQQFEWTFRHKGGALVECEVSLILYRLRDEMLIQAIVRDITQRKQAEENKRRLERELEAAKRVFYRETILSVTNGKLDICEDTDIRPYIDSTIFKTEVNSPAEVGDARRQVEAFCFEHGLEGDRLDSFMIGVGEAITNAIKHGTQGIVFVGADEESVWVGISDKGRGIESLILPRATLLRGFSTKPSLGLGYSIMLDVSDHIKLNTGAHGTTVVLIKELQEQDLSHLADRLPDTWDNIPG